LLPDVENLTVPIGIIQDIQAFGYVVIIIQRGADPSTAMVVPLNDPLFQQMLNVIPVKLEVVGFVGLYLI
jgi:uncharacterized protein (DUF1501 family)